MKIVEPNFSKNQNYILLQNPWNICLKQKGKYISLKKQVKNWKVSKILRKKGFRLTACLPASLLAWYWQRHFLHEFTENCFAVFDQSSLVIMLTLYYRLYFFLWIPRGNPLNGSDKDFLSYRRGVNMIQFRSILVSFSSMFFFFFISKLRCYGFRKSFC